MEPIILASSSPRRQEIFKQLNIPFQVKLSPEEEIIPEDMEKEKVPEYLAINKVKSVEKAYFADREIPWIFGADTMVYLDGELLGKPADSGEAAKYLERIQGRTHKVITGMALFNGKLMYVSSRTVVTEVTFAPMTKEQQTNWIHKRKELHEYEEKFVKLRNSSKEMEEMLGIPILFRMVVEAKLEDTASGVVELYDKLFRVTMERRKMKSGSREDWHKKYEQLAYEIYCNDEQFADVEDEQRADEFLYMFYIKTP